MRIEFAENLDIDEVRETLANGLRGARINFVTTNGVRHTDVVAQIPDSEFFVWQVPGKVNQVTGKDQFWDKLRNIELIEVTG